MSNSSIMDNLFQRTLDDIIKGIRLYTSDSSPSSALSSFISKAIDETRTEIKSTDPSTKSAALLKLTYLSTAFFIDFSWAAFHIVEVISYPQFYFKKIGYLAATLSFNDDTEVILLVTNQLRKDLSSLNDFEAGLGLHCLSMIGTSDLCRDLCNEVFGLLGCGRVYVRKKAVAVVLRVFRKYPEGVRVCFKRLVDNLESSDAAQGLVAVVGVFCELASNDARSYLPLSPEFYKILLECRNNWVLIKVLKIFAKLAPLEPRLAKKVVDPICEIMNRTMAKSLLFECVRTVVTSLTDFESAVKLAVSKIKEFLGEDDPNLKYLGLQALSDLTARGHSWAVLENKEAVIKSLSDVDPNIKLASLNLLMSMVSEDNVVEITKVLLSYALKSDPEFCNEILKSILATCSKNYYEIVFDFDWYTVLLGDMSRIPHCQTGEEIENQLVDIGMRVKDARQELVNVTRDLLIDPALLGNPYLHRILSAAAWVSGEYIEFSRNPYELVEALLQPRTNLLIPSIRAVYIQSVFKVLVFCLNQDESELEPNLVSKLLSLIESDLGPVLWNDDVEVQERARNVFGIVNLLKEGFLVSDIDENSSGKKEFEVTKLIYNMFDEELGPVSVNAQARIPIPDDLMLKDDLSDLDLIYSDLLQMEEAGVSIGETKEDLNSSSKSESESLLSEHRKRHDLYYLSSQKDDSTSTDYPPATVSNVLENEINDDIVKFTEQTLVPKKKRNPAKPRPVVVKLDEGDNFIPSKKLEMKKGSTDEDLLSGAVREILLTNEEELSTSSRFSSEAAKQSEIKKGKEKVTSSTLVNRKDDDGKEERRRKEKKKSRSHSKHKSQRTKSDSNTAVKHSEIPDFLL